MNDINTVIHNYWPKIILDETETKRRLNAIYGKNQIKTQPVEVKKKCQKNI